MLDPFFGTGTTGAVARTLGRRAVLLVGTGDTPFPTAPPRIDVAASVVLVDPELAELVVANGLRTGHPGFSGWVTTMPTDVGAAADLINPDPMFVPKLVGPLLTTPGVHLVKPFTRESLLVEQGIESAAQSQPVPTGNPHRT